MKRLYIWGAGGHGRVVFDCAVSTGWEVEFLDDDPGLAGRTVFGRSVQPPDEALARAAVEGAAFIVAIGDNRVRAARFETALERGLRAATLVHPAAAISPWAAIGEGTLVMPGAIVNAGAKIGRNAIVNTGAVVEHDCRVEDHVHLAPRSVLGGGVRVEAFALVGIGAAAIPGVAIGRNAVVGAGAVVVGPIGAGETAVGVPARALSARRAEAAA